MTYYIYGIFDPKKTECLYVGVSTRPKARFNQHRNSPRFANEAIIQDILDTCTTKERADVLEKEWIGIMDENAQAIRNKTFLPGRSFRRKLLYTAEMRAHQREIGRKGGLAGTGKSKARPKTAAKAAHVRWAKWRKEKKYPATWKIDNEYQPPSEWLKKNAALALRHIEEQAFKKI